MIWTRESLERMKSEIAGKDGSAVITFEGQRVLVAYAKYLIERLDPQLAPTPKVMKVSLADIERAYDAALEGE